MSLIYNATFDSQTRVLSLLDKAGNVISSCEVPSKELVDDPNKPLMLRSLKNASTVKLIKKGTLSNTYQISKNGEDWIDYRFENNIILNNESVIYFRCSNHPTTQSHSNYVQFVMTGEIEAWHNAYSMISSSFTNTGESVGDYGMCRLFLNCKSLTKAPLLLNALADYCYNSMFSGCTSLASAPQLPATTLADSCYESMFSGCTSLASAPQLPATTLANSCYYNMFYSCSKLKEVRVSATTTAMYALGNWLYGVSATGDFYCDPNATIFPTDSGSGIPKGWRRLSIDDYPVTP